MRGIAALNVLLCHGLLGFFPKKTGGFPDIWPASSSWSNKIWFCFFNGGASVTLFFVLSGFVLTRKFLISGDQSIISRGVVKRWPRLAGPVLLVVMLSWACFVFGLYRFSEVGEITRSPWLKHFAYGLGNPAAFTPSFSEAFIQGSFSTFFFGDQSYNSSLWTMKVEFIGSLLAFGLALILWPVLQTNRYTAAGVVFISGILCCIHAWQFLPFVAGVTLAAFLPRDRDVAPSSLVGLIGIFVLYLFGYTGDGSGVFHPIALLSNGLPALGVWIIGAVILIATVELSGGTARAALSGKFAAWLGWISFPVYLIQIPVLCSAGCALFLMVQSTVLGTHAAAIGFFATIALSIAAAVPLAIFNDHWVALVNKAARAALIRESPRQEPSSRLEPRPNALVQSGHGLAGVGASGGR